MFVTLSLRTPARRGLIGAALALSAALTVTACTSSGSDGDADRTAGGSTVADSSATAASASTEESPATAEGSATAESPATAESSASGADTGFTVLGAMSQLPASTLGEQVSITAADLDAATAAAGLTRPTDAAEAGAWLAPLTGGTKPDGAIVPAYVMPPDFLTYLSDPVSIEEAIGWSIVDVATYVSTAAPPLRFTVVTGDFDDSTLPATLTDLGDGMVSFGDGQDLAQDLTGDRSVDQFGRPVRLAQQDDRIAVSLTTPELKEWLAGPPSGADTVPEIAAVATTLDHHKVASALIATPAPADPLTVLGTKADKASIEQVSAQLAEFSIARPFDLVGIGWTADGDNPGVRLVYHFPGGAADAEASLDSVEHALTKGTSFTTGASIAEVMAADEIAVEVDGDTVVALISSADGRPGRALNDMLTNRDVPFVYWNPETTDGGTVSGSAPRSSAGG